MGHAALTMSTLDFQIDHTFLLTDETKKQQKPCIPAAVIPGETTQNKRSEERDTGRPNTCETIDVGFVEWFGVDEMSRGAWSLLMVLVDICVGRYWVSNLILRLGVYGW